MSIKLHALFFICATFYRATLSFQYVSRYGITRSRTALTLHESQNSESETSEEIYSDLLNKLDVEGEVLPTKPADALPYLQDPEITTKKTPELPPPVEPKPFEAPDPTPLLKDLNPISKDPTALPVESEKEGFTIDGAMKAVATGQVGVSGLFFLGGIPAALAAFRQYRMNEIAAEEAQQRIETMEKERMERKQFMEEQAKKKEEEMKRQQLELEEYIKKAKAEEERLQKNQDAVRRAAAEAVEKKRLKALEEAKAQAEKEKAEAEAKAKAQAEKEKAEAEAKAQAENEKNEAEAKAKAQAEKEKAEAEAKAQVEKEKTEAEEKVLEAKRISREVYAFAKKTKKSRSDHIRLQAAAKRAAAATANRAAGGQPEIKIDEVVSPAPSTTTLQDATAPAFIERPNFFQQRVHTCPPAKDLEQVKSPAADSQPQSNKEAETKQVQAPADSQPQPNKEAEKIASMEEDERAKRRAARLEAKFSSQAVEIADAMSIPKLKEFIKLQGGTDRLPTSKESKKSVYVSLAIELASKNTWEEALELLTEAAKSQAQGFAGKAKKKNGKKGRK